MRFCLLLAAGLVLLMQVAEIQGDYYKKCEFNSNPLRTLVKLVDPDVLNCPSLIDVKDQTYCCFNRVSLKGFNFYCCTAETFMIDTVALFLLPILALIIIAILVLRCVCCPAFLCC